MKRKLTIYLAVLTLLVLFGAFAGRLLVRDNPEKSDVIVVLDGDSLDERYERGMALLRAGYGHHLFLDTDDASHFYGHKPTEYAANFLKEDAKEMAPYVSVCPYMDNSTIGETIYVISAWKPCPRTKCCWSPVIGTARALCLSFARNCRSTTGQWPPHTICDFSVHIGGGIVSGPRPPLRNGWSCVVECH